MICDCIDIRITVDGTDIDAYVYPNGVIVNGAPQYQAEFNGSILFIEYDSFINSWIAYLFGFPAFAEFLGPNDECPFGLWLVVSNLNDITETSSRGCMIPPICSCIKLCMEQGETIMCIELNEPTGYFNQHGYWQFELFGYNFELIFNGSPMAWRIDLIETLGQDPNLGERWFTAKNSQDCPTDINFNSVNAFIEQASTSECPPCFPFQERTIKEYQSVKLPTIFTEENRGYIRCCCDYIVLASQTNDSWKNDVTSAWIKVSDLFDITSFNLYKNGVLADYQPTVNTFVRDPLARYVTINWQDVLNSDGVGCYKLEIDYSIAGINQTMIWGKYTLKTYSIQAALGTARIRVIFNSFQEIEGIDFTDSLVEDSLRFNGYIGNSQPNTEIDNLIYQNREVKKVVRENLKTYELITDPICEEFTKALTDLYLLSENQIFLSDYNAHNHSYRYQDLPAIVENTPEIEYYDFSRSAKLTCVLGDKFKNKRSYFK